MSAVNCGTPMMNAHVTKSGTNYKDGQPAVTFSCEIGYEASSGNTTRTCSTSGNWSGAALDCQRKL